MAFIIKTAAAEEFDEKLLKLKLHAYVNTSLAPQKRLAGGIEFVTALPKSSNGKIRRKELKTLAVSLMESKRTPIVPTAVIFNFDSDDELIE